MYYAVKGIKIIESEEKTWKSRMSSLSEDFIGQRFV